MSIIREIDLLSSFHTRCVDRVLCRIMLRKTCSIHERAIATRNRAAPRQRIYRGYPAADITIARIMDILNYNEETLAWATGTKG